MLLNRRHWCVNGTGLMPTNTLIRIWIQIYDFLLHIHVQEVKMSGQNLHKLHMVTNSYVLEASAEVKNKVKNYLRKTLSFSTGQLPILNWKMEKREVKRESSWYAVHSWLTSSWFHHRVLYIGIWYFLQRKARDWSFFLELSDF